MKSFRQDIFGETVNFKTFNIKKLYNEFNKLYFKNELPDIPVNFANKLKNATGLTTAEILNGELVPNSLKITISTLLEMDVETLKGVLLHEMIHVYFISTGRPNENHGAFFMAVLHDLQKKTPFKIPLTHDTSKSKISKSAKKTLVFTLIVKEKTKYTVSLFSKTVDTKKLEEIINTIYGSRDYEYMELYLIETNLSAKYPVKRSFRKGITRYLIDKSDIDEIKKKGTRIF